MENTDIKRTQILLIAMVNSVHTARWLEMYANSNIDVTLFPSTPSRSVHPKIEKLLKTDEGLKLVIPRLMRFGAFPLGILDFFLDNRIRSTIIRTFIKRQPGGYDVIHAMELQHAGYLLDRALNSCPPQRKIIASNWGSDIYWFQRFPRHRAKLERLLKRISHYSCECHRDIALAHTLGFEGVSLPVHPNAGPVSVTELQRGFSSSPPSSRKMIMIKGYTGFVGRAEIALEACRLSADALKGFEIILYSSDFKSRRLAKKISHSTGLVIKTLKKHELSHEQMLDHFRCSRVYLGVSDSDGISTSLLDAISSGAFPIQSNTSCANEWIEHGKSGFIIAPNDPAGIANCLRTAVTDDSLVDSAVGINLKTAEHRLSSSNITRDLMQFYKSN